MQITSVETFLLHVPVTNGRIEDSTHLVTHWGAPGCVIHTDGGIRGFGYTGTHGHLELDRILCRYIDNVYAPLLEGEDPFETQRLWKKLALFPPSVWTGRHGISRLALSAVDVALWDIKAKAAGQPLWKLLGGDHGKKIEAYNTDGGWLNWSEQRLVEDVRRSVEEAGFRGVKIKVGSEDGGRDLSRLEAVRKTIGNDVKLMTDANGRWDLAKALQIGRRLGDFDVGWIEEPLWYDDVRGHRELAQSIGTPIALGEQLDTLDQFQRFLEARAVHFVQPDAVRLGGVTEWLQVADVALASRLPVVSHVGDMMQVHVQTAFAHPASNSLEYIPWLRGCFVEPATAKDGFFVRPELPGAGTEVTAEALKLYGRPTQ